MVFSDLFSAVTQSCLTLGMPWTITCQAPQSMGFLRWEYWSGLPFPTPGHLPNPGIEPVSLVAPALQVDSLSPSHQGSPYKDRKRSEKWTSCVAILRHKRRGIMLLWSGTRFIMQWLQTHVEGHALHQHYQIKHFLIQHGDGQKN